MNNDFTFNYEETVRPNFFNNQWARFRIDIFRTDFNSQNHIRIFCEVDKHYCIILVNSKEKLSDRLAKLIIASSYWILSNQNWRLETLTRGQKLAQKYPYILSKFRVNWFKIRSEDKTVKLKLLAQTKIFFGKLKNPN